MVVQVDGKLRDRIEVDTTISDDDAQTVALASPAVQTQLDGTEPHRVIVRAPQAGKRRSGLAPLAYGVSPAANRPKPTVRGWNSGDVTEAGDVLPQTFQVVVVA